MTNKLYQLGQEACPKRQIQLSLIKMWLKQITGHTINSYTCKYLLSTSSA